MTLLCRRWGGLFLLLGLATAGEISEEDARVAISSFDGACTAISVAKGAMKDDSVLSTQTVDCLDCDFRQAAVPRAPNTEATEPRRVIRYHPQYPTQISHRSPTWAPENLENDAFKEGWLSKAWTDKMTVGFLPAALVDQVLRDIYERFRHEGGWVDALNEPQPYLYASLENQFGVINEKQVGVGETTCGAMFGTEPRPCHDCPGALVDLSFLSRLAMERCASARCAVELMGLLAERVGYWPAENTVFENGESLSVSDKHEVWVFHILADDTGSSAIWAAQRVPDGHITIVANEFIIREMPDAAMDGLATAPRDARGLDASQEGITDVFRASRHLRGIAERSGLLALGPNGMLDFMHTFGERDPATMGKPDKSNYSTLRRWRVLTLADPRLAEKGGYLHQPHVNWLGDGMPFSIPVTKKLRMEDVMAMHRDLYDGTPFDLRHGPAGGPFGDPGRYDGCIHCRSGMNLTLFDVVRGSFPRAISMYRTSSSFLTVSRESVPDELAMAWIGQYAPHAGAYAPIYVLPQDMPRALMTGSLYGFDDSVMYWAFAAVGNYARLMFRFMEDDIVETRGATQDPIMAAQADVEERVSRILAEAEGADSSVVAHAPREVLDGVRDEARAKAAKVLRAYQEDAVDTYVSAWKALLRRLLGKYHDGMIMHSAGGGEGLSEGMDGSHVIWMEKIFYPKWWLELAGYFKSIWPDDPPGTLSGLPPHAAPSMALAAGGQASLSSFARLEQRTESTVMSLTLAGLLCGFLGAIIGFAAGQRNGGGGARQTGSADASSRMRHRDYGAVAQEVLA